MTGVAAAEAEGLVQSRRGLAGTERAADYGSQLNGVRPVGMHAKSRIGARNVCHPAVVRP